MFLSIYISARLTVGSSSVMITGFHWLYGVLKLYITLFQTVRLYTGFHLWQTGCIDMTRIDNGISSNYYSMMLDHHIIFHPNLSALFRSILSWFITSNYWLPWLGYFIYWLISSMNLLILQLIFRCRIWLYYLNFFNMKIHVNTQI